MKERTASRSKGLFVVVAAMAVAVALCLAGCAGGVSEDKVRQDVLGSGIAAKGFVPSSYVNETPYEVVDLKIGEQKEESTGSDMKGRSVAFTGTLRNANFESQFSGTALYLKGKDDWELLTSPSSSATSSKPLKGVDTIETSGKLADNESIVEFESSFDEGNGSYRSTAKQTIEKSLWFATDTIETTQDFTFDPAEGWKESGKASVTASKTDYLLSGMKFECSTVPGIYNNEGKVLYTVTFGDVAEDGTVTADYSIAYDPAGAEGTYHAPLNAVNESGTLTGKMNRELGSDSFSVELNDPSKGVTMKCESSFATVSAGSGTVNAIGAEITTKLRYGSGEYTFLSGGGMIGTCTLTQVV